MQNPEEYIRFQLKKLRRLPKDKQVYGLNAIYAVLEKDMPRHSVRLLIDKVIKENIKNLCDDLKGIL